MVLDSRIKKGVYTAIMKGTSVMEDPELVGSAIPPEDPSSGAGRVVGGARFPA